MTVTARTVTIGDLLPFTFYEFTVVAFTIETGPGASNIVRTEEAGLCVYTISYSLGLVTLYTYTHACLSIHTFDYVAVYNVNVNTCDAFLGCHVSTHRGPKGLYRRWRT